MSGQYLLDITALAISLFNAVLLIWLGLTVWFNAENRDWGVLLACAGLLTGAVFFVTHSVILSQGASAVIQAFGFWWQVGWLPLVMAPFSWYLLMLWYNGYWEATPNLIKNRHRPWFFIDVTFTVILAAFLLTVNPLPNISHESYFDVDQLPALGSISLILLMYSVYILLTIGLALDALLRPAPSSRLLGDLARRRARPWLIGATLMLVVVSLMVGVIFLWMIQTARQYPQISDLVFKYSFTLSSIDLILAALLGAAILLLGQAIVSYEIFTGRTLPRRGFHKQWWTIVILAAVFSLLSAIFVTFQIPQIITVLTLLLFVGIAYAVFSRQSYLDQQENTRQLRPLATSQRLYDNILAPKQILPAEFDLAAPFATLCNDVLDVSQAALVPLGSLAALGISPMRFPQNSKQELPFVLGLLDQFISPQINGLPLEPERQGGYIWAAPLWNARGITGILLLGEKRSGGIYSQEEIEIARASIERLTDILASAELSRRLIMLQRQRMVESELLDRQARRVLHDEVLPCLHAALLKLGDFSQNDTWNLNDVTELLSDAHRQISDLLLELPKISTPELVRLGMVPALQQVIQREFPNDFGQVIWIVEPDAEKHLHDLPPLAAEVIYFAAREVIRNSARHAHSKENGGALRLKNQFTWENGLKIQIEDNGVGLSLGETETDGTGQGLALHSTMMAVINGSLSVESIPGEFTRVVLYLPEAALRLWEHPNLIE